MRYCLFLFFLLACQGAKLQVQEHYVSVDKLAASKLDLPYPKEKLKPQASLIIQWNTHQQSPDPSTHYLVLHTLFEDLQVQTKRYALSQKNGMVSHPLSLSKKLLSYKVELFEDHKLTHSWKHKMWVEKRYFPDEE